MKSKGNYKIWSMNFTALFVRSMKDSRICTKRNYLKWLVRLEMNSEHAQKNEMRLWSHDQVSLQQPLSTNVSLNIRFKLYFLIKTT